MKAKSESEILDFLTPYAESLNLEIVEVSFKMAKSPQLTVYIDKAGGVDLNTCEEFHNLINAPLDELNPYENSYTLNVSSPGLDRPFKTDKDFLRNIGKEVEIKLYSSIKGKKLLEGVLLKYDGQRIVVDLGNETISIELKGISKINKAIKFD